VGRSGGWVDENLNVEIAEMVLDQGEDLVPVEATESASQRGHGQRGHAEIFDGVSQAS
jgi:hypothetical protein